MANTRKFDQTAALDAITQTFWRRGYDGTTIDDLIAATGIKRQSLYNAFGDKEAMYLAAYNTYLDRWMMTALQNDDEALSAQQRIARILEGLKIIILDDGTPPGCLITNGAVEFGTQPESPMHQKLQPHFAMLEEYLTGILRTGQSRGDVSHDTDALAVARMVLGIATGMAVVYRITGNPNALEDMIAQAVNAIS